MTQSDSIFDYLEQGGTLTPLDALRLFGCLTLSQRFGELRRDRNLAAQYNFHSELVEVTGMNGKRKHVAKYWITPKVGQLELMQDLT